MSPVAVKGSKGQQKRAEKSHDGVLGSTKVHGKDREITYGDLSVEICVTGKMGVITEAKAKKLLGWVEEAEKDGWGGDYVHELKSDSGGKVRLLNNVTNRPFYTGVLASLMQEILKRRWRYNGEPVIIGRTGLILNGQHTLAALIMAAQEWRKNNKHWLQFWDTEPTIEKLIVYGVGEEDNIVNTMDTCKPRTLADVIYRSEFFMGFHMKVRRLAARYTEHAVRLLWKRTGAGLDAYSTRRTHSESLDFINRHSRVLEAVKVMMECNGKDAKIARFLTVGNSAGLLYLMGTSRTDNGEYMASQAPSEKSLDFSMWDKAKEFWTNITGHSKEFTALRLMLGKNAEMENEVRWAILIKAWLLYVEGKPFDDKNIAPYFSENDEGLEVLSECPVAGGIDLGSPKDVPEAKMPEVTKDEIKERATEIRDKKLKELKEPKAKKEKPPATNVRGSRKGDDWALGDKAWAIDTDGDHDFGIIVEEPVLCVDGITRCQLKCHNGTWEVRTDDLRLSFPQEGDRPAAFKKSGILQKIAPEEPRAKVLKFKPKSAKKPSGFIAGNVVWVDDTGSEPWRGKIVEILGSNAKVKVGQGFQGTNEVKTVKVEVLSIEQPIKH